MDVLSSPTLPSRQLSKTWWLLFHFEIPHTRLVPICKLDFNLVPELTGVFMAFMPGQRHGSGAREHRAGPLLLCPVYPFWLGGMFIHCRFAPAGLEALSSPALLRFKRAF